MRGRELVVAAVLGAGVLGAAGVAYGEDDGYIRGYVAAVAEREFGIRPTVLEVKDGVVRIEGVPLSAGQRDRFAEAIRQVRGVRDVQVQPYAAADAGAGTASTGAATRPAGAGRMDVKTAAKEAAAVAAAPVTGPVKAIRGDDRQLGLLPSGDLFDPLLADPRWPHFAATLRRYSGDDEFDTVGGADFGGTLPVYRFSTPGGGATELGLQAGVFAIFDMEGDSTDLLNADYFVALTDSYRIGDFSVLLRLSHTSSHLGDEYILTNPGIDRVNLSYERLEAIFSYDISRSWRVYAGPSWMLRVDPDDLDRWGVQYGVEWQSPWTLANGRLRPIAAADFKHFDETDWSLNLSARAGVQIEGAELKGNRLQLMLEYFTGHSPAGQFFFDEHIQWWGVGLHWFF